MASDISEYLGGQIMDWLRGNAFPSAPSSGDLYCSLWNGDPEAAGSEVTTTVRAAGRVVFNLDGATTDNPGANDADIDFGDADGAATVTYIGVHDAQAAGNLLAKKAITSASISTGELVKILTGDLELSST